MAEKTSNQIETKIEQENDDEDEEINEKKKGEHEDNDETEKKPTEDDSRALIVTCNAAAKKIEDKVRSQQVIQPSPVPKASRFKIKSQKKGKC